jgi:hypothetical protein
VGEIICEGVLVFDDEYAHRMPFFKGVDFKCIYYYRMSELNLVLIFLMAGNRKTPLG